MPRKPTDQAIEEFLSGLHQRKSSGERADAAWFIREHDEPLRKFIETKNREGRVELVRYYERVVDEYRTPPQGVCFSDSLYSIRSFRPSRNRSHSLTFPTEHKTARVVGWLVTALLVGLTLYGGYKLGEYGTYLFRDLIETREQAIEDIQPRKPGNQE